MSITCSLAGIIHFHNGIRDRNVVYYFWNWNFFIVRERSKRRAPLAPIGGGSSQAPSTVGGAETKELTYVDDGFVLGEDMIMLVQGRFKEWLTNTWYCRNDVSSHCNQLLGIIRCSQLVPIGTRESWSREKVDLGSLNWSNIWLQKTGWIK